MFLPVSNPVLDGVSNKCFFELNAVVHAPFCIRLKLGRISFTVASLDSYNIPEIGEVVFFFSTEQNP